MSRKFAATKKVKADITRPANTTAYSADDAVGTASTHVLTFSNVAGPDDNGKGYITNAMLICDGLAATAGDLELWIFDTAPAAQADQAAFGPTDAEVEGNLLGIVAFSTEKDTSANRVYIADAAELPIQFTCTGDGVRDLYGALVVRNAMSGVSGEKFTVVLDVDLNELR